MKMTEIHPQAAVAASAKLAPGVTVGAFAVVGNDVELGEGCILHPHAVVQGPARIGRDNVFHPFCCVGSDPQDYTFCGERAEVVAGDGNTFREYVSVNRGTPKGGGVTRIGNGNLFLAYAHVGHDSQVGSQTLFVNGATLAGHVAIEDFATIGAFSAVHQFCRVGRYAYIGGYTVVTQDAPPFSLIVGERGTKCFGINTVGLERKGFDAERLRTLTHAFRLLTRSKLNTTQAIAEMRAALNGSADVDELIRFIETSERGIVK